jgi:hypothetical protein
MIPLLAFPQAEFRSALPLLFCWSANGFVKGAASAVP